MFRTSAAAMGLLFAGSFAIAQEISLVKLADADADQKTIVVTRQVMRQVPQTRTVTVEVNGRPETRTEQVLATVAESMNVTTTLKAAKGFDGKGQPQTDEQMWKQLKAGAAIVLVNGQLPDADLLKLFRPETLIVVLPPKTAAPAVRP